MDARVASPISALLANEPEKYTEQRPQRDQAHVQHDGRDISTTDDPRRDEFRKAVSPKILVHCDAHKDGTRHRFVRVNGVCRSDGWESGDLDTGASIANYDNNLD